MVTSDDLTTPDWTLGVVIDGHTTVTTIQDAEQDLPRGLVPQGAEVWVSGEVDVSSYLYLVEILQNSVVVLFPPASSTSFVETGTSLRLPAGSGVFIVPADGRVRVVESPEPVQPNEWWDLLGGRDPKLDPITIGNSGVTPPKDPDTKSTQSTKSTAGSSR